MNRSRTDVVVHVAGADSVLSKIDQIKTSGTTIGPDVLSFGRTWTQKVVLAVQELLTTISCRMGMNFQLPHVDTEEV